MNKYKKIVLSNKIPLFIVSWPAAPTATALIIFKTGSRYESKRLNGISHFLEHLFFKGTRRRPNTLALASELDSLGAEYNAFTAKEYTGYWLKVAPGKLAPALDVMSDMLLHSLFKPKEIAREKGVIIEELNMYEDNPLLHIEDVFENCLYGDSPAGRETIGTKANIRRFHRTDFIRYLKTQYGAGSAFVILAGAVKEKEKRAAVKLFSAFSANPWRDKEAVREKQMRPQVKGLYKKTDSVNLSLGVRACPLGHADELKVRLLAVILGGSMSSRLFIRLRERSGLAYTVRTGTEFYSDSGYLTTQAGVPIAKTAAAIKIILAQYRKMASLPVDGRELRRAKDLLSGRVLLQMEATDNVAVWYARQAVLRPAMITPKEFLRRINKITPRQLLKTAKKIFVNDKLNLALIGPLKAETFRPILEL